MTQGKREFFSNNTIQESLCQITFKTPIDLERLAEFERKVVADGVYSISEKLPFFNVNLNLGGVETVSTKRESLNGLKLSNAQKDKIIQVFQNNLSIHQIGNYTTWEDFSADIFSVLNVFSGIFDLQIVRIDMRAINNFDFIPFGNAKDFLNLNLVIPSSFDKTHSVNFSIEQIIEPSKTFIAVRANQNKEQNNFILDLHFVELTPDGLKSSNIEQIKQILEKGHINLYNTFTTTITDLTRKKIK